MASGTELCQILFYYGFPVPGTPRPDHFMPRKHDRYSDSRESLQKGRYAYSCGGSSGLGQSALRHGRTGFPILFSGHIRDIAVYSTCP